MGRCSEKRKAIFIYMLRNYFQVSTGFPFIQDELIQLQKLKLKQRVCIALNELCILGNCILKYEAWEPKYRSLIGKKMNPRKKLNCN